MAKRLYVGGLSYKTTEDGLKDAFSQAGNVESAFVVTDKMSGRSRGFGFVEMVSEEEATKAIEMWNGKELDGRSISVSEARAKEDRPARQGFGGGGGGHGGGGYGGDRRGGGGGGGGGFGGRRQSY